MNAVLSDDGKIVLPPGLREDAQLKPGDTLEVQLYKGSIVMRKYQALTADQCEAHDDWVMVKNDRDETWSHGTRCC